MIYVLPWLLFSFIVGLIGSNRKIGFFGAFILSLLLSPLIGFIITIVSKSKSDIFRDKQSRVAQEYNNFINSRKDNPTAFTYKELKEGQQYVKLDARLIPNSQIGKPIFIHRYYAKEDKPLKYGAKVLQIRAGDGLVDFKMPNDGVFFKIHNPRSFLMPNDDLFIISKA